MDPSSRPPLRRRLYAALLAAAGLLASAAPPAAAQSGFDSLTLTFTPRDAWPPAPVADLTATPGAEGQLLLQWTAPDSNSNALPVTTPALNYMIRVATFSVDSVGGSTSTWWSSAMDVQSLPAPAISAAPPAPAAPGTGQTLLLNQLWPGATYYAAILSYDQAGNVSDLDTGARTPGGQARALVYDAAPPSPSGVTASTTSNSSLQVAWNAVAAYDLWLYRVYVDSTPPYDFSDAWAAAVSSASTTTSLYSLTGGTYAVRVSAVDLGAPSYAGVALESAITSSAVVQVLGYTRVPQAPYGVSLTTAAASATLDWLPVVRYADGAAFTDPAAPTSAELTGYAVYRGTSPVLGTWSQMAVVSTATLTWTDLASAPQYYYYVVAQNASGSSARSAMRAVATRDMYVVAPDDQSYFYIPAAYAAQLTAGGMTGAYQIFASSQPQDLGGWNGRVVKSVSFQPLLGGATPAQYTLPGNGTVHLHYELSGGSVTPSALSPSGVYPSPQNMSVYWYNGTNWLQLYGRLDAANQAMTIQSPYFGQYQLRTVERTGSFFFNAAGLSNRFLTPNSDDKNDAVVFTYDNPKDSEVVISIYDLRGRLVVSGLPSGPVSNSQRWDGRAGGRIVPGGVYLYEVKAEGQTYTGTIVVIR